MATKKIYTFENETIVQLRNIGREPTTLMQRAQDGPVIITQQGRGQLVVLPLQVYRHMVRREIYQVADINIPFTPTFKKFGKVVAFLKQQPPSILERCPPVRVQERSLMDGDAIKYDCSHEIVALATRLCLMHAERPEHYPASHA